MPELAWRVSSASIRKCHNWSNVTYANNSHCNSSTITSQGTKTRAGSQVTHSYHLTAISTDNPIIVRRFRRWFCALHSPASWTQLQLGVHSYSSSSGSVTLWCDSACAWVTVPQLPLHTEQRQLIRGESQRCCLLHSSLCRISTWLLAVTCRDCSISAATALQNSHHFKRSFPCP